MASTHSPHTLVTPGLACGGVFACEESSAVPMNSGFDAVWRVRDGEPASDATAPDSGVRYMSGCNLSLNITTNKKHEHK